MKYVIWNTETHRILRCGRTSAIEAQPIPAGHQIMEIAEYIDDDLFRIDANGVPYRFVDRDYSLRLIEQERLRRLSAGFDYDFGDDRGVHRIGTTEEDRKGWDDVSDLASALIDTGNPNGEIAIVTDTGPVTVSAAEWKLVLLAAAQFRQPIWAASFALQAMGVIPEDVTDDTHWGA